jgi:hypothetical protein
MKIHARENSSLRLRLQGSFGTPFGFLVSPVNTPRQANAMSVLPAPVEFP